MIANTPTYSSMRYNSIASHILLAAKEDGVKEADNFLLEALGYSIRSFLTSRNSRFTIVPVPSSNWATRKRGRDFMMEIASKLGGAEAIPVQNLLRHNRRIADQSGLSAPRRERNVSGAMSVIARAKSPRNVILLDDLVTTGSTLNEAVRALRHSGISVLGAITAFLALPIR